MATAASKLLKLPGLKKYFNRLATPVEKEHFQRHLRKYVSIYMPDCPFEVNTTNRYDISLQEACVTARKPIKRGHEIKYLTGIQVGITKEEEETLDLTRTDFSIVMSSRKKTPSLFLGPARFANHDCNANAKLNTTGAHGMQVMAVKDIEIGDEITVTYGVDYFGEDNCECLCSTCERLRRNGWGPVKGSDDDEEDEEVSSGSRSKGKTTPNEVTPAPVESEPGLPYGFRRKRKYGSVSPEQLSTPAPEESAPSNTKRRRIGSVSSTTTPDPVSSPLHQSFTKIKVERTSSHLSTVVCSESIEAEIKLEIKVEPSTPPVQSPPVAGRRRSLRKGLLSNSSSVDESDAGRSSSPLSSSADGSSQSNQSTAATSVDADSNDDSGRASKRRPSGLKALEKTVQGPLKNKRLQSVSRISETDSDLSDLESNLDLDDSNHTITERKRIPRTRSRSKLDVKLEAQDRKSTPIPSTEPADPNLKYARQPNDYTLTTALLSTPYSRWVLCRNEPCGSDFVQHEAYLTRVNCPRCERHSKLYGYAWPKTEKEGKLDTEERILDHRQIHRFIWPDEERLEKRRGEGRLGIGRLGSETVEGMKILKKFGPKRGRLRPDGQPWRWG